MRVIEPHRLQNLNKSRQPKKGGYLKVLSVLAVILIIFFGVGKLGNGHQGQKTNGSTESGSPPKSSHLRNFTGAEFARLYNSFSHPNTQRISEDALITGNQAADLRLKKLAKARGYSPQSAPVSEVLKTVENMYLLQPKAADGWAQLKSKARADGIILGLTAGYRSAAGAKKLFLEKIRDQHIAFSLIASGKYDNQLQQILANNALPGYSRHHSGYGIDISCPNEPSVIFKRSTCFAWLSKNNYQNAKASGWIPSYPPGAGQQGPDPEPWEYIWVGIEALLE